ncbi:hypothetical protein CROQUDRAFT_66443 [Cronartium quercuum f. sp. fusiforme G11]|uniref:Minichromosome loss protein Mcl1 middle region domain-containing protein n=1 Tax=Cronartium quercuum f. sp. fusiforme G11 TaxID=708437 RepID=A0A9P6NCU6_9BASI|nr:hypothetical protein CROQUDRAFT_66443 [Cronartium quercuum f. sp. fusiforme G11]
MTSSSSGSCKTLPLHGEGVVSLAYSPDARYLYSSGSDCIRCLDINDPLECLATIEFHKKPVTYLDCSTDYLVSCSESGETALHQHSSVANQPATFRSLITRFSLPSRCVKFSPDFKKVAVCSDELIVKIIDVERPVDCQVLSGHSKSPKSLSWSPNSDLLLSSGCDGTLKLWKIASDGNGNDPDCIQTIENLIPFILPEDFKTIEAVWNPSTNSFIVPTRDQGIAVFEANVRDNLWKKVHVVQYHDTSANRFPDVLSGHRSALTSLAFSPNGGYLATGFEDGLIILWDTRLWRYICHSKSDVGACITSIRWKPRGNALVIGDQQGQIIAWNDAIPLERDHPSLALQTTSSNSAMKQGISAFDTTDADISDLDSYGGGLDDDDWVIDNTRPAANPTTSDYSSRTAKYAKATQPLSHHKTGFLQQTFQSGATKLRHNSGSTGDQPRRYMAFNDVGFVQVLEKDTENIVTVEYHDRGKRNPYHFTDRLGFNLCSMSELGVAFACGSNKSGATESVIRYDPHESWATEGMSFAQLGEAGSHSEGGWQYSLPRGENAICLACGGSEIGSEDWRSEGVTGSGSVVVGTSKGYIRFFTGSGIQSYVWNVGQHIISLACSDEWLFVVHCAPVDSSGPLQYSMMDTSTFEIIQEGIIPLANGKVSLTWIGFTTQYRIPACFTSSGVLSFLDKARRPKQGRWVPVLDTDNLQQSDGSTKRTYWPIGASDTQLSCMILKGGETQPGFPTPVVQEVDLSIPLLRLDETQGQLEETHLRGSLIHHHHSDLSSADDQSTNLQLQSQKVELDKQLLKLIQTCCKHHPTPELQRALDYANLLQNISSLEAASKIPKFFNLVGLDDRITKVKELKELQVGIVPAKRVGKYDHLENYNIITRSKPAMNGRTEASRREVFNTKFDNIVAMAHSQGGGGLLSKGNVFQRPPPERIIDVGTESWQEDEARDENHDWTCEYPTQDIPTPGQEHLETQIDKAPRLSEYHLGREPTTQKSVCTNPFAKKALRQTLPHESGFDANHNRSNSPPSPNPFSSKKHTPYLSGLKKPAAFLDHVDERGGITGSVGKGKTRQSTLFGLSSNASETAAAGMKKGKKRKNEGDQGTSTAVETPKAKAMRPLDRFLAKDAVKRAQESIDSLKGSKQSASGPEAVMPDNLTRLNDSATEKDLESVTDNLSAVEDESQMSLMSIDFSQSLPPRIRSTHPHPGAEDDAELNAEAQ